jgi:hypothetical protein
MGFAQEGARHELSNDFLPGIYEVLDEIYRFNN